MHYPYLKQRVNSRKPRIGVGLNMTAEARKDVFPSQSRRLEDILRIAADVFMRQGFERTSIDEIARVASTSKATIYKYYKSKVGLFEHVLARETEVTSSKLLGNFGRPDNFTTNLRGLAVSILEIVTSDRYLQTRNLFSSTSHGINFGCGWYENVYAPFLQKLGAILDEQMQIGLLLKDDPIQAADTFVSLVYGTTVELMAMGARQQPTIGEQRRLADNAVVQFLRCYRPLPAPKPTKN